MKKQLAVFGEGIEYKYEALACAVLNCRRYEDAFGGIANHDEYTHFVPVVTTKGTRMLSIILTAMILNDPANTELKELEKQVWEAQSQHDAINIIDKATSIYEEKELLQ